MTTMTQTIGLIAQDPKLLTLEDLKAIVLEAKTAARLAALAHIDQYGEQFYCGFAWVNIYGVKGNTKLGKLFKAAGVQQDYTKAYTIWNPSDLGTQCMATKEAGARAAADVFTRYGFRAYMGSRAD
jgi:hypothetical protein